MNISFLAHPCPAFPTAEPLRGHSKPRAPLCLVQTFPQLCAIGLGHSLPLEHGECFIPVEYFRKISPGVTDSLLAPQTTAFILSLQDITMYQPSTLLILLFISTINKSYHGDSDEELQIMWLANDFPHPILRVPEIANKTSQLQPRTRSVTDFLQL